MNELLIFFAFPIAVIIISIALQKVLNCPILVASIIFAFFLVVTFVIDDILLLIGVIIYTIISFITALLTCIIARIARRFRNICKDDYNDGNGCVNELLTINTVNNIDNNSNDCKCRNNSDAVARINVIPNNMENGRTGRICGCYRRR